jgi:hypothetical protein
MVNTSRTGKNFRPDKLVLWYKKLARFCLTPIIVKDSVVNAPDIFQFNEITQAEYLCPYSGVSLACLQCTARRNKK